MWHLRDLLSAGFCRICRICYLGDLLSAGSAKCLEDLLSAGSTRWYLQDMLYVVGGVLRILDGFVKLHPFW